jgi:hypothetical protein
MQGVGSFWQFVFRFVVSDGLGEGVVGLDEILRELKHYVLACLGQKSFGLLLKG